MKLYEALADELAGLMASGVLRPGEKLPSVRQQQERRGVSPSTVFQAYYQLEARGLIESRPRSGYYVAARRFAATPEPEVSQPDAASTLVDVSELVFMPSQLALAQYLGQGGYERHLRQLRGALAGQQQQMLAAIEAHFPAGTRVTRPQGGHFLWVVLPESVDALALHRLALGQGISIAPGPMFSAKRGFRHCVRLNYGHIWGQRQEAAIAILGMLAKTGNPAGLAVPSDPQGQTLLRGGRWPGV